jgi:hypothetical protein
MQRFYKVGIMKKNDLSQSPDVWEKEIVAASDSESVEQDRAITWHSPAKVVCCVNSYPNGLTVSIHSRSKNPELTGSFALRFRDTRNYQLPEGNYFLYKKDLRRSLEKHLSRLHKKGLLSSTVLYFGTTVDPFAAFHKRFDITNMCLELFEKYRPQKLVIQTRSPMVIAALPTLKLFGEQAVVVIPIETNKESVISRYTPGQTKISQRLLAAQGLRGQGILVNLSVGPVLPYGDYQRDAWDFAELLDRYGDYISLACLASGTVDDERILKALPIARKLETDGCYQWLRPTADKPLRKAIRTMSPEKLILPIDPEYKPSQMTMFAA